MKLEEVTGAIERHQKIKCKYGTYYADALLSYYGRHSGWRYSLRLIDIPTKGRSVLYAPVEECEVINV